MAKYLFGNYLLDVDERRLLRDNEEIRLRGKLFDTLRVLVDERVFPHELAGILRMTHIAVEQRRAEFEVRVRLASKIQRHLAQAEQVKVVDQERGHEHEGETEAERRVDGVPNHWIGDIPKRHRQ
jgi:hypothetical protein